MKTTFIYGLVDPADPWEIRYVGRTQNLQQRLREHVCRGAAPSRRYNVGLAVWVYQLLQTGRSPQMVMLQELQNPTKDICRDAESGAMAALRAQGHRLFNRKAGGGGHYQETWTATYRERAGKASALRYEDQEFREANRQKQVESHASEEYRARLSGILRGGYEAGRKPSPGFSGRKHSAEARAKIGDAGKGRKRPPEEVAKIVAFHTGRKRSPETCRRISEARKASFERKQSLNEV